MDLPASECLSQDNENQQLQCVINALSTNRKQSQNAAVVVFLLFCSVLVFLMQAGFAMVCSGCVRKKNVQNTMLKSILDGELHTTIFVCQLSLFPISLTTFLDSVSGSSIAFYFVGYAFAFGGDPEKVSFIGSSNFLLLDAGSGDTKALFQSPLVLPICICSNCR